MIEGRRPSPGGAPEGLPIGTELVDGRSLSEVAREGALAPEQAARLVRTLADLCQAMGADRRIAISRERTKLHEECWRGTLHIVYADGTVSEVRRLPAP